MQRGPPIGTLLFAFILLLDAGNVLGQFLLALDVTLTGDHDALSLGRAGAVHGLGTIANSGCAQAAGKSAWNAS